MEKRKAPIQIILYDLMGFFYPFDLYSVRTLVSTSCRVDIKTSSKLVFLFYIKNEVNLSVRASASTSCG